MKKSPGPTSSPACPAAQAVPAAGGEGAEATDRSLARTPAAATPAAGPGPAPTALHPGLGETPRRVLTLLVDSGAPLDVADVADVLGGHPNSARGHLDVLADRGLARRAARPTGRRGRPRLAYEATARGRLAVTPPALEQLLSAFAEHLTTATQPALEALAVGRAWGAALARTAGDDGSAADVVCSLLEHAGFSPRPDATGRDIALRTCPILDAARAHPEVVCEVHRGMVAGALAAAGVGADVELVPFAEAGACRLRVISAG